MPGGFLFRNKNKFSNPERIPPVPNSGIVFLYIKGLNANNIRIFTKKAYKINNILLSNLK